jgi:glycosyltransferase involved in cell wall biosynthesis
MQSELDLEKGKAHIIVEIIEYLPLNNKFENSFQIEICALESENEQHNYSEEPLYKLNTNQRNSFAKTAFAINKNPNIKIVVLQHEFGFYANKEFEFENFYKFINKQIVFVFHTVLPNPNEQLKLQVCEMAAKATSVIAMTFNASQILTNDYGIESNKIIVIHHGTHLVPVVEKIVLKKKYNIDGKKVLSTFGLLSSSKGIEVTLSALKDIITTHPNVLFLILGKTHPTVLKNEGEKYRNKLKEKISELNIEKYVRFVNEYLPLPILLDYLQLTDIYLFTSKDPNQAVSGTFSYAVSCGCAVISTPIPHAKEVLGNDTGIIVDFERPDQLANAVKSILDDEELQMKIGINGIHKMASTSWENSAIAHAKLFEKLQPKNLKLNYKSPPIILTHLIKMTTDFGIVQFSKIGTPDLETGYTLDDNARALITLCMYLKNRSNNKEVILINKYLTFIEHCILDNGTFLNYVDKNKKFTKTNFVENLEDSNGRAIWALGYLISMKGKLPYEFIDRAETLMKKAIPKLLTIHSTRAMSFILKGLYYQNDKKNISVIKTIADRLVQMYRHEKTTEWHWFENYMTYGNSALPESMLCAYISTKDKNYLKIAEESFSFLLSKIFIKNVIKPISNKGWYRKDVDLTSKIGGEQPIDVAYTLLALEQFYLQTNNLKYKEMANIAFNWFLGENHLNQIIYNPCTGGCYDGLEETNVNLNQGAESTLSYLMSRLTIDKINSLENNEFIGKLITNPTYTILEYA